MTNKCTWILTMGHTRLFPFIPVSNKVTSAYTGKHIRIIEKYNTQSQDFRFPVEHKPVEVIKILIINP